MSVWFDRSAQRWRIRIRRRGKEVSRYLPPGTSRAQADEYHARVLRELVDAAYLGRERHSVADALERLVREEIAHLKRPDNVLSNCRALLPLIAGVDLAEADVVASRINARGWSRATKNRRIALVRRACNLAWKKWRWLDGPVHLVTPVERNARHTYLSRGEVELLAWFAGAWHPLAGDYVLIAAWTGLRQGEILGLRPGQVRDGVVVLPTSKSGAPRGVPVHPRIRARLRHWLRHPKPHKRTLYAAFEAARSALGRPDVRFHDLRHTLASWLANAGAGLHVIGDLLGHSDRRTTLRYAHLQLEAKKRAISLI